MAIQKLEQKFLKIENKSRKLIFAKKAFTSSKILRKMTIQKIQPQKIDRIQRKHNLWQKWGQKIGIKVDGIINEKPKN